MNANEYNKARLAAGKIPVEAITALTDFYQKAHKELEDDGKLGAFTLSHLLPKPEDQRPPTGVWPLTELPDGRKPVITSGFRNPHRPKHTGVDLFYRYFPDKDPPMKVGDGGRTAKWWIPEGTEAIATHAGQIVRAGKIATGYRVELDIGNGWSTVYIHLASLGHGVVAGNHAASGDVIGIVGDNPVDHDADHLHFELWHNGERKDPKLLLDTSGVLKAF